MARWGKFGRRPGQLVFGDAHFALAIRREVGLFPSRVTPDEFAPLIRRAYINALIQRVDKITHSLWGDFIPHFN
jgi:hypothetical protein